MINVSGTKCPHCEQTGFECVNDTPFGMTFEKMYIRCMHCKTFLSMTNTSNTNILIDNLQSDLNKIKNKFGII